MYYLQILSYLLMSCKKVMFIHRLAAIDFLLHGTAKYDARQTRQQFVYIPTARGVNVLCVLCVCVRERGTNAPVGPHTTHSSEF